MERMEQLRARIARSVIGQEHVVERLLIGLLANGNLLVEGLPGLAKTRAVKALAGAIAARFSRIQFTPDLLPADITGTEVLHTGPEGHAFRFEPGPVFANIVLADEINRAPAKVQAALLEAMEERQVTVGGRTHRLPELFTVVATQNPVEHEGTYPLPEAQLDRFLMHVLIDYPDAEAETEILRLVRREELAAAGAADDAPAIPQEAIFEARAAIARVEVHPLVERYIVDLVSATRAPRALDPDLARWIAVGASPRGALALDRCARARAWLRGRGAVLPEDVQDVAPDCLRHRLLLGYQAGADGVSASTVVERLLERVAVAA